MRKTDRSWTASIGICGTRMDNLVILFRRGRQGQGFSVRDTEAGFSGTVVTHCQARNYIAVEPFKHSRAGRSTHGVAEKEHRVDLSTRITFRQFTPAEIQGRHLPAFQGSDGLLYYLTRASKN